MMPESETRGPVRGVDVLRGAKSVRARRRAGRALLLAWTIVGCAPGRAAPPTTVPTPAAMRQGAMGMTTALIYPPSSYATTDELAEVAKAVARHGGGEERDARTAGAEAAADTDTGEVTG
jgi:hypothetical protein